MHMDRQVHSCVLYLLYKTRNDCFENKNKICIYQQIFPLCQAHNFVGLEVNKGDNKEAVFTGLFPGGLYSVTIVTVVGTNPEVVSASSQASFRISEYHITLNV